MKRITILTLLPIIILLSACGSPATAATQAPVEATQPVAESGGNGNSTQVDITLADNTIEASQSTFQVGVPYTFVVTNTGRHAHNFNINAPVSVAGSLDAALSGALLAVNQNQLSPGASVRVEFTFPESAAGQLLEFSCLIRKHYEDGMLLAITVTK